MEKQPQDPQRYDRPCAPPLPSVTLDPEPAQAALRARAPEG
jgi:hypothetical protein